MVEFVIHREQKQTQYFTEDLVYGVGLDMVLIAGERFEMGSPDGELEHFGTEGPQHTVVVPTLFVGRYPVTQAQWRTVATLSAVDRALEIDPACFKGDERPVERVSWWDAVEFCQRLCRLTKRQYRLPSEAEWEYACRAGTTTPFHFGETITPELANYRGSVAYGEGPTGKYRRETTPVGTFPANVFGLCDMHGNVWEWCADHWHDSYVGAPDNETIWLSSDENAPRVVRGGSWDNDPRYCCSASRDGFNCDNTLNNTGFRVVCVVPRLS